MAMSMEASMSDTEKGMPKKHAFLQTKLQVGSCKGDKINYPLAQKTFHSGDVRPDVHEAKRLVIKSKQPNILGTEPRSWNQSTIANPKIEKEVVKDLKRQLLKVRAGLMDEYTVKPSKFHTDENVEGLQKFIVGMTGRGPLGMLTGKWQNMVDERGLSKHCIREDWPDWNNSTTTHTKEDISEAHLVMDKKDTRRKKMITKDPKLDAATYVDPAASVVNINDRLRERKVDFQELKEQFKRELKVEFPQASEERLQAMAQRLLNEKLLADEKMARFPVQHESFRPNLCLTTQDRRYKEFYHPGVWMWNESEKRMCWSCCMNFSETSKGCESRVINPDAWCTLGFERKY